MKIEVSAKSIEKAIEEGLKKLNTTIENVTVNVITEGDIKPLLTKVNSSFLFICSHI